MPPDESADEPLLEPAPTGPPTPPDEYVEMIRATADKLARDQASRGDVKLLATALREMRYSFQMFRRYRGTRKVTIFGSARTRPDHPAYRAAVEFAGQVRDAGYMVITGAASGIMEAGHVGAGRDQSFGLNILLPFEAGANRVIHGDPKLVTFRYFFTRKLLFLKESDAVALFPGGFGTHDEAFEALTLMQTGKSHIVPIVMVDEPGGTYWKRWQDFVVRELLDRGYIGPHDLALYRLADSVEDAVAEVTRFYRVYHSMRYVKSDLAIRLQRPVSDATLERVNAEFADILVSGRFTQTGMLAPEANEPGLTHLTRLVFRYNRVAVGRLRMLIDVLNGDGE